jgi:hypothetical protein
MDEWMRMSKRVLSCLSIGSFLFTASIAMHAQMALQAFFSEMQFWRAGHCSTAMPDKYGAMGVWPLAAQAVHAVLRRCVREHCVERGLML